MGMKRIQLLIVFTAALWVTAAALAAEPPSTGEVLNKLHQANEHEVEMGKLAQARGYSTEAKQFGKTLIDDHSAADKKVVELAKLKNVTLNAVAPMKEMNLPSGPAFDAAFGKAMIEDHRKDIAEVKTARDSTTDAKLKRLLVELLPTLEKHEKIAQKLASGPAETDRPVSTPEARR